MEKWIRVSKKTFDIYCEAHKLEGQEHWHFYEMKDKNGKCRAFFQHGSFSNYWKIMSEVEEDFKEVRYEDIPKDLFPLRDFFKDKEL